MGLSYYDVRHKPQTRLASALVCWNGIIAVSMLFYWSGLAAFVGEPFRWAMKGGVSVNPAWLEYPYLTLWLVPMLCMFAGWLALKTDRYSVARVIGLYPSLTLAMMMGWYYFTPHQWH
jgi:hypothetical protein